MKESKIEIKEMDDPHFGLDDFKDAENTKQ